VASVLVFAVLDVLPGNVAQVILGDTATPSRLQRWNKSSASTGRCTSLPRLGWRLAARPDGTESHS
jgi:hypothetical protein